MELLCGLSHDKWNTVITALEGMEDMKDKWTKEHVVGRFINCEKRRNDDFLSKSGKAMLLGGGRDKQTSNEKKKDAGARRRQGLARLQLWNLGSGLASFSST